MNNDIPVKELHTSMDPNEDIESLDITDDRSIKVYEKVIYESRTINGISSFLLASKYFYYSIVLGFLYIFTTMTMIVLFLLKLVFSFINYLIVSIEVLVNSDSKSTRLSFITLYGGLILLIIYLIIIYVVHYFNL